MTFHIFYLGIFMTEKINKYPAAFLNSLEKKSFYCSYTILFNVNFPKIPNDPLILKNRWAPSNLFLIFSNAKFFLWGSQFRFLGFRQKLMGLLKVLTWQVKRTLNQHWGKYNPQKLFWEFSGCSPPNVLGTYNIPINIVLRC